VLFRRLLARRAVYAASAALAFAGVHVASAQRVSKQDHHLADPDEISVAVELLNSFGVTFGSVKFWRPVAAKDPGTRAEIALRGFSGWLPNRYELVLRPGTCTKPGTGRGFNITTWGPFPNNEHPVEQLQGTTWAVEVYDVKWNDLRLSSPRTGCGEHDGGALLQTNAASAARIANAARTEKDGRIVVRVRLARDDGTVILRSLRQGTRTKIEVEYSAIGGSSDVVGRVRPGTCTRLLAARDIPVRLWGDKDSDYQYGSMVLPIAFNRFRHEQFVAELGGSSRGTWYGDGVYVCIQLSPAR
jgi:hypothetical protein